MQGLRLKGRARQASPGGRNLLRTEEQGGGKEQRRPTSKSRLAMPTLLLIPPPTLHQKAACKNRKRLPAKVTRHWQVRARGPLSGEVCAGDGAAWKKVPDTWWAQRPTPTCALAWGLPPTE